MSVGDHLSDTVVNKYYQLLIRYQLRNVGFCSIHLSLSVVIILTVKLKCSHIVDFTHKEMNRSLCGYQWWYWCIISNISTFSGLRSGVICLRHARSGTSKGGPALQAWVHWCVKIIKIITSQLIALFIKWFVCHYVLGWGCRPTSDAKKKLPNKYRTVNPVLWWFGDTPRSGVGDLYYQKSPFAPSSPK